MLLHLPILRSLRIITGRLNGPTGVVLTVRRNPREKKHMSSISQTVILLPAYHSYRPRDEKHRSWEKETLMHIARARNEHGRYHAAMYHLSKSSDHSHVQAYPCPVARNARHPP